MNTTPILRDKPRHYALALALGIGLGTGGVNGATLTYDLGPQDAGTTFQPVADSMGNLLPWITKGTLPVGSIITEVSATIRLDAATTDAWASDLLIYFDGAPEAPGTAALLQIGGDYSGPVGTVSQHVGWNGGDGGPGETINQTLTAGVDWTGDVDLNDVQLSIGYNYNSTATWSGTISVTYDAVPEPATLIDFRSAGNRHVIDAGKKIVSLSVPSGWDFEG